MAKYEGWVPAAAAATTRGMVDGSYCLRMTKDGAYCVWVGLMRWCFLCMGAKEGERERG